MRTALRSTVIASLAGMAFVFAAGGVIDVADGLARSRLRTVEFNERGS